MAVFFKEAISFDEQGKYQQAYAKYQLALDKFLFLLKYQKNESVKRGMMKHVQVTVPVPSGLSFKPVRCTPCCSSNADPVPAE